MHELTAKLRSGTYTFAVFKLLGSSILINKHRVKHISTRCLLSLLCPLFSIRNFVDDSLYPATHTEFEPGEYPVYDAVVCAHGSVNIPP